MLKSVPLEPRPIHTIAIYPRLHVDTTCAVFLLREFGEQNFPGIREAKIDYWSRVPDGKTADALETEGVLLVDMGGGKFDHHHEQHAAERTDCASTLIAKYLGVDQVPALRKLLAFARRDDLEGKGILSTDLLDRAFGLPAVLMNLNRDYPEHPDFVLDIVSRVYLAHYHEEYRRTVLMPQEWQRLQAEGKAVRVDVAAGTERLHVVLVETDSKALVGFLRAIQSVHADVVVQRASTNHTYIVTRTRPPRLDLRPVIAAIRRAEAERKGVDVSGLTRDAREKPGRLPGVEEWYFDTAANTLQNGGPDPTGITPTRLTLAEIQAILEQTLPSSFPPAEQGPSAPTAHTVRFRDLRPRSPALRPSPPHE